MPDSLDQTLRLFRADKRQFAVGGTIATAGEFMSKHPEIGGPAEALLECLRPTEKPKREGCLMLFENEACARDHWWRMTDGKLYLVEIPRFAVLHRGDMKLVDAIGHRLLENQAADDLAAAYWQGQQMEPFCIEVLVAEGKVVEQIGTNAQRLEYVKARLGIQPHRKEALEEIFLDVERDEPSS